MKFVDGRFTVLEEIDLLQRWVLVHSYLYYILDTSVISDHMFDRNCEQLAKYYERCPKDWEASRYGYAMGEFTGGTGFGMVEKLLQSEYGSILNDVKYLLAIQREEAM